MSENDTGRSLSAWRRADNRRFLVVVAVSVMALAGGGEAAAEPLRTGVETGNHLSGNHVRPGPGWTGRDRRQHVRDDDPFAPHRRGHPHVDGNFVRRVGARLMLRGDEFRFAGTNNYYLPYKSELMVDDVLERAADQGFTVIRTWGFIDIGNQDGSGSVDHKADGVVYFHYFDGAQPAFNDGPDGLQHLDYVIKRAGELGLRVVLPLVNNWREFGGIDQYVRWAGGQYHDQFYADATIKGWFKAWIAHVLFHQNYYTGVRYKDDPTIMTFELGNEPRCGGSGVYPRSPACTAATLTSWADEMSRFIKRIDRNHLVSMGDEGFYCDGASPDWTDQCSEGVDTIALAELPAMDVMSFHLYPDYWGFDAAWGTEWINRHFADALAIRKPAMLGEYGWLDKSTRNRTYREWTDTTLSVGGAGALYWILSGLQDDLTLYPDYDGFTVYCPGGVCQTISNFAAMMTADRQLTFAPVADDDFAETVSVTPVTLAILANDTTYGGAALSPGTVDLDPSTPGQQAMLAVLGGAFAVSPDGTVTFAANPDFVGNAVGHYVVADAQGRVSDPATLTVKVDPDPALAGLLFSFEDGSDGWTAVNDPAGAMLEQSADYASHGSYSLKITPTHDDWFGANFATPLDLTGKTRLSWEVKTTDSGSSQELAIQTGDNWDWCQAGTWEWVNAGTEKTVEIDLSTLSCGDALPDLSQVHALHLYLGNGGPGAIYIDDIKDN